MDFQKLKSKGYTTDTITIESFDALLKKYQSVVPAKLEELEEQRLKIIPKALAERDDAYLTKAELQTLMEWKLNHGTFRPSLRKLVASNSEETVEACTREGFETYKTDEDWSKSVTDLAKGLKGVGPATASLLLNAYNSEKVPFFSDELFRWIMFAEGKGGGWDRKIKYSMGEYKDMYGRVEEVRERLSDGDRKVTCTEVEMVAYVLGRMDEGVELEEEETKSEKIRAESNDEKGDEAKEKKSGRIKEKRKGSADGDAGRRKRRKD